MSKHEAGIFSRSESNPKLQSFGQYSREELIPFSSEKEIENMLSAWRENSSLDFVPDDWGE